MITINLAQARAIIEAEKNKPQPKRVLIIGRASNEAPAPAPELKASPQPTPGLSPASIPDKGELSRQCWHEYNQLRIEQAKVSNTIHDAVTSGASLQQLQYLYQEIESYRPGLINLYERARHVDQYGTLPEVKKENGHLVDINSLKVQRKSLIDVRCKLAAKIKRGHIKEAKVLDWKMQLDIANADYAYVDEKIKAMEGK